MVNIDEGWQFIYSVSILREDSQSMACQYAIFSIQKGQPGIRDELGKGIEENMS
jgi:hypothetical protein